MITEEIESTVRSNWLRAAQELNFEIITPYTISIDGNNKEVFAFLPEYGSKQGAIVCLTSFSDDNDIYKEVIQWAGINQIFCSLIGPLSVYDKEYFIDILEDWKIS